MKIRPGGFTEAGISTTDLEGWADFLVTIGGYQEVWRGQTPDSTKPLWGIPASTPVTECLLGAPGFDSGYIRLFQFGQIEQEEIRRNSNCRVSGGIFDLDIRVASVLPLVEPLKKRGWTDFSRPVDWPFGELQVREWLTEGPDSVILALIERLAPPLEEYRQLKGFSHVFNSSQIVSDMDRAIGFYDLLGFQKILHHKGPLGGQGGEVLALSPEEAPVTPVDLVILQPDGILSGSVELVKLEGKCDRDVSAKGLPYNLGLNLLRFPVKGLGAYATQLEALGLKSANPSVHSTTIEPFGPTEMFAVQTPDGAWLEFYEAF